jgi:DNA repair photolyase
MKQSNLTLNNTNLYTNLTNIGLDWSINPYLQPQNTFSNFNIWQNTAETNFNSTINFQASKQVAQLFAQHTWQNKLVSLSGNVDCYNKLEGKLKLTRSLLKLCILHHNPICIITRNDLILRDMDLLLQLQSKKLLQVFVQINTTNNTIRAKLEPTSSNYYNRILLLKTLIDHHISSGVMIAPVIKGLTDDCTEKIIIDATHVGNIVFRKSALQIRAKDILHFKATMEAYFPTEVHKILCNLDDSIIGSHNKSISV